MEYVIKHVESNPDGAHCGTSYYLAANESVMQRIVNAFKDGHDYDTVTCLGPIVEPPKWVKAIVEKHT